MKVWIAFGAILCVSPMVLFAFALIGLKRRFAKEDAEIKAFWREFGELK